jgi:hypothetical protein
LGISIALILGNGYESADDWAALLHLDSYSITVILFLDLLWAK